MGMEGGGALTGRATLTKLYWQERITTAARVGGCGVVCRFLEVFGMSLLLIFPHVPCPQLHQATCRMSILGKVQVAVFMFWFICLF